jgi:MFS family permease
MSVPNDIVRQTFFWDRFRGTSQGILETGYMGLTLVIAIEVFDASNDVKSLIAAANPMGLMLTPLTLVLFTWLKRPANRIASNLLLAAGVCLAAAAFSQSLTPYLVFLILSAVLGTQAIPLMAHIYAENYPPNKRGAYLSISFMFSVAATFFFSALFGKLMDVDISYYSLVLGVLALACLLSGFSVSRMPSSPIHKESTQNPLRNLSYAFTDWKFGIMLFSWMFVGLGNLMVMPLRIEYLLKPEYGIAASISMVTWLTLGLPAICRFVSARFWGRLFDSIDFMVLRMIINALQMFSIVIFFSTKNYWVLGFATALNGIGMGGGNLSWNLWVTKFATRERTAAYMSVHTFLTGVRGFAAPFLGFYLLARWGSKITGGIGSTMILISIVMVYILYLCTRPKQPEVSLT